MPKNINHKKKLLLLRKWGLAPKIDLRHQLSPTDKQFITRRFNKFNEVVTSDPGEFVKRHVKSSTKNKIKKAGFITFKNSVFIATDGATVHIKNDIIKRTFKSGKTQSLLLLPKSKNILDLLKEKQNKKLRQGETITVSIGENAPFTKSIAISYNDLENYLKLWMPADNNKNSIELRELREQLINNMVIVKIPR